jgi:hypothetical protein
VQGKHAGRHIELARLLMPLRAKGVNLLELCLQSEPCAGNRRGCVSAQQARASASAACLGTVLTRRYAMTAAGPGRSCMDTCCYRPGWLQHPVA